MWTGAEEDMGPAGSVDIDFTYTVDANTDPTGGKRVEEKCLVLCQYVPATGKRHQFNVAAF